MSEHDRNRPLGADASGNPVSVSLSAPTIQAVESWAAAQPQKLGRDEAVEALLAGALRAEGFMAGGETEGLRPDELNAENDG